LEGQHVQLDWTHLQLRMQLFWMQQQAMGSAQQALHVCLCFYALPVHQQDALRL
jgi:hypothetical protein